MLFVLMFMKTKFVSNALAVAHKWIEMFYQDFHSHFYYNGISHPLSHIVTFIVSSYLLRGYLS